MSMVDFYLWTDQNLTGRLGNYTLVLPPLPIGEVLGHLVRKTDTNYLENNNCKKYFQELSAVVVWKFSLSPVELQ